MSLGLVVWIIGLESRTAVLALLASLLYITFPFFQQRTGRHKIVLAYAVIFLAALFSAAIFLITESSAGRWFIWKQSIELWQKNWLWGLGYGRFNTAFNHIQAYYFSNNNLYSREAMLAGDGYFAFNEWLHTWIELGLAGFLIFIAASFFVLKVCVRIVNTSDNWAGAMVIPIFIGCLFSYPLHNLYLLGAACLLTGYITRDYHIPGVRLSAKVSLMVLLLLAAILYVYGSKYLRAIDQFREAQALAKHGMKNEAVKQSVQIAGRLRQDYRFTSFYLHLLYDTRRLQEAVKWFELFHPYHCNHAIHRVIANCYDELGEFEKAEENYLTCLYIKPHLLQSRLNLMEFYHRNQQMEKAAYWALETIYYPAKKQNDRVSFVRNKAIKFLDTLSLHK